MSDPQPIGFVPKWFRNEPAERIEEISGSAFGDPPPDFPRLVARIVPRNGTCTLSAKSLAETLQLEQNLVQYAARDVVYGLNPDFADLRSLKDAVLQFGRLTVEPMQEGSFVIPARLESEPLPFGEGSENRPFRTEEVLHRWIEIVNCIRSPERAASVSMGALQTLESFGRLLDREAEFVEFTPYDDLRTELETTKLDPAAIDGFRTLLRRRKATDRPLERVRGRLTALDTDTNKFRLAVPNQSQRSDGTCMAFHMHWMRDRLGSEIELDCFVERRRNRIAYLTVHRVVDADAGSAPE